MRLDDVDLGEICIGWLESGSDMRSQGVLLSDPLGDKGL